MGSFLTQNIEVNALVDVAMFIGGVAGDDGLVGEAQAVEHQLEAEETAVISKRTKSLVQKAHTNTGLQIMLMQNEKQIKR